MYLVEERQRAFVIYEEQSPFLLQEHNVSVVL